MKTYLVGFQHSDDCTYSFFEPIVALEDHDEAEYLHLMLCEAWEEARNRRLNDHDHNVIVDYREVSIVVTGSDFATPHWETIPMIPKK